MNNSYKLGEYVEMINKALSEALPECDYNESVVCDAMRYSCDCGGKRIRPVLVLEFCRICGGDIELAMPFACAIEMIHTYSLIHDDLPCMDDDDMRRGKPSCHKQFGENYALLAGDALLTHAFVTASSSKLSITDPAKAVEAIKILSTLAGANGMVGGQVIDLRNEGKRTSLETLRKMDELKTGALIKAACLMGVVIAGADDERKKAAATYAEKIGQAFQIVDDILDVTGDEKLLGKPIGSDAESDKSTYVSIMGLEESKRIADELTARAVSCLDIFGEDSDFLKKLAIDLASRNN